MTNSLSNLLVAVLSVVLWALLLVVSRILLLRYGFDPWSFTFIQLIGGGVILIALSFGSTVDWLSLRRMSTWIYGVLRVTTAAAFTAAVAHVSVVHAGFLGVMNVPITLGAVWIFLSRPPKMRTLPGHLLIMSGIVLLITQLEDGIYNPAVGLMIVSELAVVSSSLIAEKHPDNNAASPHARRRFTGVVLLLTAGLFLVVRLGQDVVLIGGLSNSSDNFGLLFDEQLWVSGLTLGILLRGPAMHTSLQAIRLVGTETYMIVVALLPFVGWGFETIARQLNLLSSTPLPTFDIVLGSIIVTGSLYIILVRQQ